MSQRPTTRPEAQSVTGDDIMALIKEGMKVFDRDGKEIGTVSSLYLGTVSEEQAERGTGAATANSPDKPMENTLVAEIAKIFAPNDNIPETVRNRLRRNGFIRINYYGIFTSDRYALREQIQGVSDSGVHLNVTGEDLIKGD